MTEIKKKSSAKSLLKVTLHGLPRSGVVPVPLLIEICKGLQSAIDRQALIEAKGQESQPVESTLELVRLGRGSTVLEFELASSQQLLPGQIQIGERAVASVVELVRELGKAKAPALATRYDAGVVGSLRSMAKVFSPDLRVALRVPKERAGNPELLRGDFSSKTIERVESLKLETLVAYSNFAPKIELKTVDGVVEMADFRPSDHKFRLVLLYGQPIICAFDESMSTEVHRLTRAVARVTGLAQIDQNDRVLSFNVQTIASREGSLGEWNTKSLAQLIEQQNVKPLRTISDLAGIWPEHEPNPN